MPSAAASPVTEAVYGVLQDPTLLATLAGGWHDDVPQEPTFPFGWFEILRERDERGFGTGALPLLELRTHVFSEYGGMWQAQAANRLTVAVLKDVALSVTGYTMCGHVFYDETITLADEVLNGVKVHEVVSMFRIFIES